MCKECIRSGEFAEKIELGKICNHFICKNLVLEDFLVTVESIGQIPPEEIFK